jgi:hypothetical protein
MASNKLFALNSLNQDIVDSSDLSEIFQQTKEKMMDVIGVTQHHDAATGTGKQHVADDYARLIFGQLENTNPVYAKALNFWAEKSGFEANDWTWCQRTNSTYEDCPIANYAHDTEVKFLLAVHNPSALPMKLANIAVPHGNLSV